MAFHEYIWKERVYLCQLAISSLLSLTWLKIEWLCVANGGTPAVWQWIGTYINTHVKRYLLDMHKLDTVCVCLWRAEMNKKDSCHTLWLSHTHTRAYTRVTAAVWPASSIFRQIRESDRLLSGLLIAGPLVPVSQSQQERATPNSWPLRTTTRTPHPGSPPGSFICRWSHLS